MNAVDWTALSALAAIFLGGLGYLARRLERLDHRLDRLEDRIDERFARVDERFDRLEERYVRHLELHATGSAP